MAGFELRPSGLVRIDRDEISVSVPRRTGGVGSSIHLRLVSSRPELTALPSDATVALTLDHSYARQESLALGTWSEFVVGVQTFSREGTDGALGARLTVTSSDPAESKKLLATADLRIDLGRDDRGTSSLLMAEYDDKLGELPFWVEIDPHPKLRLNSKFRESPGYEESSIFKGLVFPDIARRVAEWLTSEDCDLEEATPRAWLRALTPGSTEHLGDRLAVIRQDGDGHGSLAAQEWVQDVCRHFASTHRPLKYMLEKEEASL